MSITYERARSLVSLPFVYVGVTALDAVTCAFDKQVTEVEGVSVMATAAELPSLAGKLLPVPEGWTEPEYVQVVDEGPVPLEGQ